MDNVINIGLIGFGYWGKILLRNLRSNANFSVKAVCDRDYETIMSLDCNRYCDPVLMYESEGLDAVVIATPASSHYSLAKQALLNGCHVLVEKPMCSSFVDSIGLVDLAKEKELVLMCDHTFLFTPEIEFIKKYIDNEELGNIVSISSTRLNFGKFQEDVNVVWDLCPHDLSIAQHLLHPYFNTLTMFSTKTDYAGQTAEVVVSISTSHNVKVNIHNSWISPTKERKLTIVGDRKILVWDDTKKEDKITIFNKKFRSGEHVNNGYFVPHYESWEPLSKMIDHFSDCILQGEKCVSSGELGSDIVEVLVRIDD